MKDLRKASKKLLQILDDKPELCGLVFWIDNLKSAREELRQALAQPEQRPVGTYEEVMETMLSLRKGTLEQQQIYTHMKDKFLYTEPPTMPDDLITTYEKGFRDGQAKRDTECRRPEWVGLTDDEFTAIARKYSLPTRVGLEYFKDELEAKLKEKNT